MPSSLKMRRAEGWKVDCVRTGRSVVVGSRGDMSVGGREGLKDGTDSGVLGRKGMQDRELFGDWKD